MLVMIIFESFQMAYRFFIHRTYLIMVDNYQDLKVQFTFKIYFVKLFMPLCVQILKFWNIIIYIIVQ